MRLLNTLALSAVLVTCVSVSALAASKKKPVKKAVTRTEDQGFHRHQFGVGLQIAAGTFSGISGVMPFDKNVFLQGTVGVAILNGSLSLTGDYVMEFPDLINTGGTVFPYAGAGAVFLSGQDYASLISDTDGDMHFGARLPLGAYIMLTDFPVQIFGEVAPGLLFMPRVAPILSIALGFRWMF